MENYTPFGFYRDFIEKDLPIELEKFYWENDEAELFEFYVREDGKTHSSGYITNKDRKNHIIEYINHAEKCSTSLEDRVREKFSNEVNKTLQYIEKGFEERLSNTEKLNSFSKFLKIGLNSIKNIKSYEEYTFLKKYFDKIESLISIYSDINIEDSVIKYQQFYSFNLISENQKTTIEKLYDLLTEEPSIVKSRKEDFHNAFSGKTVTEGINWLVTGKNKQTSKVSLFYFLNELINKGFIEKKTILDLNKYVKYIFRDKDGNELQNIKQSKGTLSNNPRYSKRLSAIISSL